MQPLFLCCFVFSQKAGLRPAARERSFGSSGFLDFFWEIRFVTNILCYDTHTEPSQFSINNTTKIMVIKTPVYGQ